MPVPVGGFTPLQALQASEGCDWLPSPNGCFCIHEVILNYFMHTRAKPRNGVAPCAVDEEFELVITCTCSQDHEPLLVEFNQRGMPKKVSGNDACWYGLFVFCTSHLTATPGKKLLQNWNCKHKCWGSQNRSTAELLM